MAERFYLCIDLKSFFASVEARIYTCPSDYPASDESAKSLDECYKYSKNGNKVYYSEKRTNNNSVSYDLDAVESMQAKLQILSDKTTKIRQGTYDAQSIKALTVELQVLLNQANEIASKI